MGKMKKQTLTERNKSAIKFTKFLLKSKMILPKQISAYMERMVILIKDNLKVLPKQVDIFADKK
jgi:hypothetical protein